MRRYWFRRTDMLHWTPVTWEAWTTLALFVVVGPGGDIFLLTNAQTAMFAGLWMMAALAALVIVVLKTGEPR